MTTVVELVVAAEPDAWRAAGFAVEADGRCVLGDVVLRLVGGTGGITAWTLADAPVQTDDIDGLRTEHAEADVPAAVDQPNGVSGIDHVVVNTPDLERTCAAIEAATGAPLKRIREAGPIRQGFHRLGSLIVEVVNHPGVSSTQAEFWGLALNALDLDAVYARCGDALMSAPKDAVQPGRRIASFRESAGLGMPVALMTPHVRR